jgi:hypothetical protein
LQTALGQTYAQCTKFFLTLFIALMVTTDGFSKGLHQIYIKMPGMSIFPVRFLSLGTPASSPAGASQQLRSNLCLG